MSEASGLKLLGPVGDEGPEDEYVLAVEGLSKRFGSAPDLYHDMHLRIRRGEIVVIVGESGIGKSVFLKHLIGLEDPTRGGIWYRRGGKTARDWPVHLLSEADMKDIRREISMVFQASSLFDWMTVYENISLPLEEHRPLIEARLAGYLDDPTELLVIIRRAKKAPDVFSGLAQHVSSARQTLAEAVEGLAAAPDEKGDPELERALVNAFGADAAEELPAARSAPEAGSPWGEAGGLLSGWSTETLGDLLVSVEEDELSKAVARFRSRYIHARRGLRKVWETIRREWREDFSDLAALLAQAWLGAQGETVTAAHAGAVLAKARTKAGAADPDAALAKVVEDWAEREGVGLDGSKASGSERLRQALCLLKVRPSLIAGALERAGAAAPAVFGPLKVALAEFTQHRREVEKDLAEHASGEGEAELRHAILLAWLAVRPMAVDREADSSALLRALLDGFSERPEELGLLLARRPGDAPPQALARFLQAHEAFRTAFVQAYRDLLEKRGEELVEQFTELVVNGLMNAVKLDVERDREKLPSELSGGMRTRVGLARSLATLPSVVLYDEPTAGLDPVLAKDVAREILELQTSGVVSTSVVVTHDKDLYQTLKLAGRTRMLYLSSGRFLDVEARPVRDPLRLGENFESGTPIEENGSRGYPPATFIQEFEPKDEQPDLKG